MTNDNFISGFVNFDPSINENNESRFEQKEIKVSGNAILPFISDFSALERLNSEGSTCETYRWEHLSRVYFVKRLKSEFLHSRQHIHAYEKEYELGSRLSHPSLPRYIDLKLTPTECYIVMQYIDGQTLQELWHNPLTANLAITYRILYQLVDVLEYLHRNNIAHYDLLPQNVMLTNGLHNVVLIDLDKAFHSAYVNTSGDVSRFDVDSDRHNSADTDYRALANIINKGLWGGYQYGDLKHFYDLCQKPGVTAAELRSALDHKYDEVFIHNKVICEGDNCDTYKGTWKLQPVFIKKLKPEVSNNSYFLEKMRDEYETMLDNPNPYLAEYILFRHIGEECYIVMEKCEGITLAQMLKEHHPWLDDWENIRGVLLQFLGVLRFLWEEGLDHLDYDAEDVFINPGNGIITVANLREVLDTRVEEVRLNSCVRRFKDAKTGEITERKIYTTPKDIPLRLPLICRIIDRLAAEGVDVEWLMEFRDACHMGARLRELADLLDKRRNNS